MTTPFTHPARWLAVPGLTWTIPAFIHALLTVLSYSQAAKTAYPMDWEGEAAPDGAKELKAPEHRSYLQSCPTLPPSSGCPPLSPPCLIPRHALSI